MKFFKVVKLFRIVKFFEIATFSWFAKYIDISFSKIVLLGN